MSYCYRLRSNVIVCQTEGSSSIVMGDICRRMDGQTDRQSEGASVFRAFVKSISRRLGPSLPFQAAYVEPI